jgi:putative membrane protein
MIAGYLDHAANERTFLAWVRTAIAMMAFGFVIERFDLFLKYVAPPATQQEIAPHGGVFADAAGLAFSALGVALIAIAGWRFAQTAKDIESDNEVAGPGERFHLALSGMIGLLGIALFLYLSHAILPLLGNSMIMLDSSRAANSGRMQPSDAEKLAFLFELPVSGYES